jgi:hypothetical protein
MPPYEEPIVSPIAFTIGGSGFNVKDHLASNTDLTIWIGDTGANVSIYGDDDCGDEICGWAAACDDTSSPWYEYCNCVANCFGSNGEDLSTERNAGNLQKWRDWKKLQSDIEDDHLTALIGYIGVGYATGLSLLTIIINAIKDGVTGISAILATPEIAIAIAAGVGAALLVYLYYRSCVKGYRKWIDESTLSMEGYDTVEERIISYQALDDDCREKCAKHAPTA